ncbi:MAG: hypothetical protein Q8Q54_18050 [Methylococcales bacterium]|nr:hypothetical protein [Methylococcales bacterium]
MNSRAERKAKADKVATAFFDRESLSIDEFYQRYYNETDIPYSVVAGVIKILEEYLDADMSYLRGEDDFSNNINFFWDYDSMANTEIVCALEKEFNIKILDAEAEETTAVNDIFNLVARKIS